MTVTVDRIATGFDQPLFATTPPNDTSRLFVVEQHSGRIEIVDLASGVTLPTPFLQVPGVAQGSEQGLLGLAFHPDYASNGRFYVNFTDALGDTVIREYQVSAGTPNVADPASARTILTFDQPFANHNGGWLGFGPDGFLYVASGDGGGGGDPNNSAQDITDQRLGKILRLDVDGDDFPADANRNYAIPVDNPFVGLLGDDEIWAFGLRNPWRPSFDRLTGDFYIADVGQGQREEVNFQPAASGGGENYGWKVLEGTLVFSILPGNPPANDPSLIAPIHQYSHSGAPNGGSSITGGYVYRGPIAELQGVYFFADFISGQIWTFRYDGAAKTEFTNRTLQLVPRAGAIDAIASFGEDALGNLYIIDYDGDIFRVAPVSALFTSAIDAVDFNQVPAASYIAGTQYDALAGDDLVILPDLDAASAAGFTIGTPFSGGADDDTVIGGDGGDVVLGGGGDDLLAGADGADLLAGEAGADTLAGGGGNDSLDGGDGDDTVQGGSGNDSVNGGIGDAGADSLDGGAGNDTLHGGNGGDTLIGGDGDDALSAHVGVDTASGGDGDSLDGGDGNDNLTGAQGNDIIGGGAGNDVADAGGGDDSLLGGVGDDSLFGNLGADSIDGANGNDDLLGGDGNDQVEGGDGNDAIDGGNGNDDLAGGDDDDTIDGGNGSDEVQGGSGDDSLNGGLGDDADDFLDGGDGNDTITTATDDDTLSGGAGADLFMISVEGTATGTPLITDAAIGEAIFLGPVLLPGVVTPGDGTALAAGRVQFSSSGGTNLLHIGRDGQPGADQSIELLGSFTANSFRIVGSSVIAIEPPVISIADATIVEGIGGQDDLVFTISIGDPRGEDVTVTATTSNGTALAAQDFTQAGRTVTIPAGQSSASFAVSVLGDATLEPTETFTVTLSDPVNALIGDGAAIGTILDDGGVKLVSIDPASAAEGNVGTGNAQFTISLSSPSLLDVIVTASSSDDTATAGGDYSATSSQVTIPAGQASAIFTVPVAGDTLAEPDETFVVTLSSPINADLGPTSSALGTVLNDDAPAPPPVLSVADVNIEEGNTGVRHLVFTLNLSAASGQAVSAVTTTGDGTATSDADYVGINDQIVVIPAGQTSGSVTVTVLSDTAVEGDETLTLTLANPVGATFSGGGATLAATGAIVDDDTAQLSIGAASAGEGNAGTTELSFPLTLSSALGTSTVVSFRAVNGLANAATDFTAVASGSATIPAGQTVGTVAIGVLGDTVLECDESLIVELTSVTGGAAIDPTAARAAGTIVNDDIGNTPVIDGRVLAGGPLSDGLFGFLSGDSIAGGGGGDTLVGDAGGDILAGEDGADFLVGENGGDSLVGGAGDDILAGGAGEDTMRGGDDDDALFGNSGNDTALGGNGDDVLLGEDGDDLLCGEDGNDFLIGGNGADRLDAGIGDDRVAADGGDVYAGGGAGLDVLAIVATGITSVTLASPTNQNTGQTGPLIQGFEAVDATQAQNAVAVSGTGVIGGTVLVGGGFNDTLTGSSVADIILGGDGADLLDAGAGNDSLFADAGNDTITAGAGQDSIRFGDGAAGAVRITDFAPLDDTVILPAKFGVVTPAQARLLLQDIAGNAALDLGDGASITFVGMLSAALSASDFVIA